MDVNELMKKCEELEGRILKVRTAVAHANLAVSDKLVELDVLKKRQRFISQIPCDESLMDRMESSFIKKEAVVKAMDILNMNESLTDRINAIQDELDGFNASTKVEIEG